MAGRRWTKAQWAAFAAELKELERTDPDVRRARERLDEAIWAIGHRPPPRRFLRRLGGHSRSPGADT